MPERVKQFGISFSLFCPLFRKRNTWDSLRQVMCYQTWTGGLSLALIAQFVHSHHYRKHWKQTTYHVFCPKSREILVRASHRCLNLVHLFQSWRQTTLQTSLYLCFTWYITSWFKSHAADHNPYTCILYVSRFFYFQHLNTIALCMHGINQDVKLYRQWDSASDNAVIMSPRLFWEFWTQN